VTEPATSSNQDVDELPTFERHRALVRETDKKFATIYGAGGAGVIGAASVVLVVFWLFGALASLLPWVLAVTVGLVSVFALRGIVNAQRRRLRASIESYCELNAIDLGALRDYYAADGIYPYFESLFDQRERA